MTPLIDRGRARTLRLARGRRGTSYTLPFVLLVPFYLTFMLTAIEAGFLVVAKIGTQYAAFAGTRSAIVWLSAQPAELRDGRIRQSVFTALAAFIGGRQREIDAAGPPPPGADEQADDYAAVVSAAAPGSTARNPASGRRYGRAVTVPDSEFLKRKYRNAAARTRIVLSADPSGPHGDVTVTVTFRAPLYMPVVSRFLDPDGAAPFEFPITSSATLPNEAPKTRDGRPVRKLKVEVDITRGAAVPTAAPGDENRPLGIPYSSAERRN